MAVSVPPCLALLNQQIARSTEYFTHHQQRGPLKVRIFMLREELHCIYVKSSQNDVMACDHRRPQTHGLRICTLAQTQLLQFASQNCSAIDFLTNQDCCIEVGAAAFSTMQLHLSARPPVRCLWHPVPGPTAAASPSQVSSRSSFTSQHRSFRHRCALDQSRCRKSQLSCNTAGLFLVSAISV